MLVDILSHNNHNSLFRIVLIFLKYITTYYYTTLSQPRIELSSYREHFFGPRKNWAGVKKKIKTGHYNF